MRPFSAALPLSIFLLYSSAANPSGSSRRGQHSADIWHDIISSRTSENDHTGYFAGPAPRDQAVSDVFLVWGQMNDSNNWLMVELHAKRTSRSKVLLKTTRASSPVECSFALRAHDEVVFLDGVQLVTYNLTTGKQLNQQELKDPAFESFDYNPNSGQFEGVCQLWRPEQNSSESCWCSLDGDELKYVFQMPTDFYGEARSGCVGHLNAAQNSFWYPAVVFGSEKWLVGIGAGSQPDPVDAQWFGVINGSSDGSDAYVHDYSRNKSYAVQLANNSTSQLVEVVRGTEPWEKNNSYPRWLSDFPPGFRIGADGLMDYNEQSEQMYVIMHGSSGERAGIKRVGDYLVTIDMKNSVAMTFEPIEWPDESFQAASLKIWQ